MDVLGFGGDAMRVKRCERRRDWVVRFWRSEWGGGFDRGVVCAIVGKYRILSCGCRRTFVDENKGDVRKE